MQFICLGVVFFLDIYFNGRPYIGFAHMFDTGFCSAGEHKVRPYIGFGNWLDLDYYDLPENL
jgi:hypothetical protein